MTRIPDPVTHGARRQPRRGQGAQASHRRGVPGAGEEAGDAGDVQAVEVAEEDLAEVQVDQRLQRLHRCGTLQRQQRAVVVHCYLCLAAVRLRMPPDISRMCLPPRHGLPDTIVSALPPSECTCHHEPF